MRDIHFLPILLNMFGEGDGSSGAEGSGSEGESNAMPSSTRKAKGEFANVLYGKQEGTEETVSEDPAKPEGEATEKRTDAASIEEALEKEFRELIKGKYKGQYTKATQEMINKRFGETKRLEEANREMQEVLDVLYDRYKTKNAKALLAAISDDSDLWQEEADAAGLTVEQYKKFRRLERQEESRKKADEARRVEEQVNAQMRKWFDEGEELKKTFPAFDLQAEVSNPRFLAMLKSGVDVATAYKAAHMDEIMTDAMKSTQALAEKKVSDNIRARGNRPIENGATGRSPFTVKNDVTKLTREDREEIAKRAARGERISF